MCLFFFPNLQQLWCGPKACSLHGRNRSAECQAGQSCVAVRDEHCFVKPCSSQGECWSTTQQTRAVPRCHPNSSCVNITFTFNKDVMTKVFLFVVLTSLGLEFHTMEHALLNNVPIMPSKCLWQFATQTI